MDLVASLSGVRGDCRGMPKLTVTIHVKSNHENVLKTLNVVAEVRAHRTIQVHNFLGTSYFLGYALLEGDGGQFSRGSEQIWQLGMVLSPYHLQKIEEIRKGGDLYLCMQFFCQAADLGTDPPQLRNLVSPQIRGATWSSNYVPFRIPKSDWLPVLRNLGYGDYYLIEVPLRGVPERSELKKALTYLTKAWDHFNLGADSEALGSCHKAFERIALDHNAKPDQNGWEKVLQGVDRTRREKLKHMLARMCDYLQLGRHEPKDERIELDRFDAEYALIMTQATLAYLARLSSTCRAIPQTDAASAVGVGTQAPTITPSQPSNEALQPTAHKPRRG
jgi:hypothetical protein